MPIQVSNLQLPAGGGPERGCNLNCVLVIKVESGHGEAGFWLRWFFFEADRMAVGVQFNHSVTLRILDLIGKHRRSVLAVGSFAQIQRQVVTIEDVVSQDQNTGRAARELPANCVGLCQSSGTGLGGVGKIKSPLAAIAQEILKERQVRRG